MIDETVGLIGFDAAAEQVRSEVDRLLTASPRMVRGCLSHLSGSRGKFIRAGSVLACAENGDGLVHLDAVKFASAIELLHLATLVHDDVIDDAPLRRGIATLQKKYGKRTAVICGDYLFCLALRQASSVADRKAYEDFDFPDYIGRVCLGELSETQNRRNLDLSVLRYLRIIDGKTAALFEASFYAGAIVLRAPAAELKKYKKLGHYIGMIFQLTDDCIDFEAPEQLAQKPVRSDFEQGVITLPLIYAFRGDAACKQQAKDRRLSRQEAGEAVMRTGGLKDTRNVSKKYYDKAAALLPELDATEAKKARIASILDRAYRGLGPAARR